MGFFDAVKTLLSGGEISFEKTTHVNPAKNLLNADRQSYIGEWRGANTNLSIKADGAIEYRRSEVVGDTTNTDTVSGPINNFDGASFTVGVLGRNTRFEIVEPPHQNGNGRMTMTVNGERLERV
ncbi:MAG TPA: hypothetical protein VGB00_17785 [Pyrinomonadaceae bacterium]|jgi:hypothetical protein